MYDDVDHIESMSAEEYRQVLYYLKHPSEYEGDYQTFLDKIIEYGDLIHRSTDPIDAQYKKQIKENPLIKKE